MKRFRSAFGRRLPAAAAVAALALAATAIPASAGTAAATPGWRIVFKHHYGKASTYSGYTNLAVVGPGDTWALGSNDIAGEPAPGAPVAVHWNGKGWTASAMPAGVTGAIAASAVLSAKDIWAITDGGGYIVRWNGSKWLLAKHLPGGPALLTGITALNDHDVWVFGSTPVGPGYGTWHYDGHVWKPFTTLAAAVGVATATSPSNIWGFGSGALGPDQQIDHYNGHAWADVTPASLAVAAKKFQLFFSGAWAESATSTWVTAATGKAGGARLYHVVSGKWTAQRLPWPADDLGQPMRDGNGGFWLQAQVSSAFWIWHRTAAGKWSRISSVPGSGIGPSVLIDILHFAPVPKTSSLWAVGAAFAKARANSTATVWAYGPLR